MMPGQGRSSESAHGLVLFCGCGPSGTVGMSGGTIDWPHLPLFLLLLRMLHKRRWHLVYGGLLQKKRRIFQHYLRLYTILCKRLSYCTVEFTCPHFVCRLYGCHGTEFLL